MGTLALPFFILLWWWNQGRQDQTEPGPTPGTTVPPWPGSAPKPAPAPPTTHAPAPTHPSSVPMASAHHAPSTVPVRAAPWNPPAGVPAFPGPSWEPDSPVGPGVASRAAQLLSELWRYGAGTTKVEQTGGRWIAYRATPMGSKHGVVAYRLRSEAPSPATVPTSYTPAASHPAQPLSSIHLPTLRRGSHGPDVVHLQQRLGITADGAFGPKTEAAVRTYQRAHGLVADGIVGSRTWASLYGGGNA